MGAFVAIPGCCKIEILGRDTTFLTPIVNVLHASCGTTPAYSDLLAIATAISGIYGPPDNNNASWPDTYTMDYIVVTDLNSSSGPQATLAVGLAGTDGDAIPSVAAKAEFGTALRGRSYRGGMYIPVSESQVTTSDGEVKTTYITNMLSILAEIQTAIQAIGGVFDLVVASRKLHTFHPITSLAIRAGIGYIRRRLLG